MKKSCIAIIIFHIALLSVAVGYVVSIMPDPFAIIEPKFEKLMLTPLSDNCLVTVINVKQWGVNAKTVLDDSKILYNGKLSSNYPVEDRPRCYFGKLDISKPTDQTYATFVFPKGNTWKSGMNVTITIQTEANSRYGYSITVNLP